MATRPQWKIDLDRNIAESDAGMVRFCHVGRHRQVLSMSIKKEFVGAYVRLCHDALQAIRVAEYNARLEAVSRLDSVGFAQASGSD
ncbi:hypothetical protein [Azospirillum canadense]|uniref:hypothetical protein n=1 Tax=Azospirillum canadense TaxID=403962 RepID=UPI0022278583|nr:hypothetical protein [Azospirillum canadense]MCW2240887.1 hypothetical protein [Azospirillum canadense]